MKLCMFLPIVWTHIYDLHPVATSATQSTEKVQTRIDTIFIISHFDKDFPSSTDI